MATSSAATSPATRWSTSGRPHSRAPSVLQGLLARASQHPVRSSPPGRADRPAPVRPIMPGSIQIFGIVVRRGPDHPDLIIGLSNGLIFALVALGYTLVYGIIELINFAHGDVFMLGSMIALFPDRHRVQGWRRATSPLRLILGGHPHHRVTMATTARSTSRSSGWPIGPSGHAPKVAPLDLRHRHELRAAERRHSHRRAREQEHRQLPPDDEPSVGLRDHDDLRDVQQLFVAVVTLPLLFGLTWFVAKTRQGRAMRATAQDPDTAGLMGVDVNRTIALTFLHRRRAGRRGGRGADPLQQRRPSGTSASGSA